MSAPKAQPMGSSGQVPAPSPGDPVPPSGGHDYPLTFSVDLSACTSNDLQRIGLNDAINCIAKEKGATPVDAFTPFQSGCTNRDCFSDLLHPDDKGYGLIFDALRDTPGTAVPATPPPDGTWPMATGAPTNTLLPTVAGIPAPGSLLSCSLGTWSGSALIHFTVEWLSDNSPIAGHTASTYLVPATDLGHEISCRVTASNADGSAEATSGSLKVTSPPPLRATISALSETKKAFAPSGLTTSAAPCSRSGSTSRRGARSRFSARPLAGESVGAAVILALLCATGHDAPARS